MACIKAARRDKSSFYLVPTKALAEEKYVQFNNLYFDLGIKTVISTRDHQQYDDDIRKLNFHIAVVVYEKMKNLLVLKPSLLEEVGLVVVDELQMVGDEVRGPDLEILLTKILLAKHRPQLIALSAVLGNYKELASWLNAKLVIDNYRPIELAS